MCNKWFKTACHLAIATGSSLVWAAMVAAQTLSTTRPASDTPTSQPASPTPNPHWASDGCRHCHDIRNARIQPLAPDKAESVCLNCHDGRRAKAEQHPVGLAFESEQVKKPEGWPLLDGRLSCVTCHNVRRACDQPTRLPDGNTGFIRDWQSSDPLAFCARCHVRSESHTRHNPHRMLTPSGELVKRACLLCHLSTPEATDRMARTGQPELRTNEFSLCLNCHSRHVDYFEPGHIGAKVPQEIRETLRGRLPLSDDDLILCSTCHNPHQAGLFPEGSELARGAMTYDGKVRSLGFRGLDKELCLACHKK